MSGWRLMDTAPKDGRPILIYDPTRPADEDRIYVVRWRQYHDLHTRAVIGAGWQEAGGEQHEEYHPTRWQPLPNEP